MQIAWQYLNKRTAAVSALKDYRSIQAVIANTDGKIKEEYSRMESIGGPNCGGIPGAGDPKAGENRVVSGIAEIDVLIERYRQAVEFLDWFQPAWDELSDDDKYILQKFYMEESDTGAVDGLCDYFSIERSSVYNRKNRALEKLVLLLYGKR